MKFLRKPTFIEQLWCLLLPCPRCICILHFMGEFCIILNIKIFRHFPTHWLLRRTTRNRGTLINVSVGHTKEGSRREKLWCFFFKILLKLHFKNTGHFFPKSGHFLCKIRAHFFYFQKRTGETSPLLKLLEAYLIFTPFPI